MKILLSSSSKRTFRSKPLIAITCGAWKAKRRDGKWKRWSTVMERRGRWKQLCFNIHSETETTKLTRAKKWRTWRHPKNCVPVQNERNKALKHGPTRQNTPNTAPCKAQTVPCKKPQETKKPLSYETPTWELPTLALLHKPTGPLLFLGCDAPSTLFNRGRQGKMPSMASRYAQSCPKQLLIPVWREYSRRWGPGWFEDRWMVASWCKEGLTMLCGLTLCYLLQVQVADWLV
jgi:hypothetical protein